jgi:hypothetical protein
MLTSSLPFSFSFLKLLSYKHVLCVEGYWGEFPQPESSILSKTSLSTRHGHDSRYENKAEKEEARSCLLLDALADKT